MRHVTSTQFGLDVEITAAEAVIYIICWIKIPLI